MLQVEIWTLSGKCFHLHTEKYSVMHKDNPRELSAGDVQFPKKEEEEGFWCLHFLPGSHWK